jgi:DNA-binding beta-propeller fold protein YncE
MSAGHARAGLFQAGAVFAAAALASGCGSQYRPVVTPIGTSGPPAQPSSYAVVVSAPSPTTAGIATIIDYSGDTVLAEAPIGPGPINFTLDEVGGTGYTLDSDGTLSNFPISTSLQAKNVTFSTLSATAQPVNLFSPSAGLWIPDLSGSVVDVFTGSPQAFKLAVPVAPTPVAVIGPGSVGQRDFAISQGNSQGGNVSSAMTCNSSPRTAPLGEADAIETSTYSVSAHIAVGKCPVYAVQSPDSRRLFVLNRGDDTITVINSQNDTLDSCTPFQNQSGAWITCHPSLPLSTSAGLAGSNVPAVAGPVYAEYNAATSQLVVANYDGNTISVIDLTEDEYGNDFNTYANPTCTINGVTSYANCGAITGGFGTTYTIPVGNNPASVTVLADGSRAYTANQTDQTVTIVNLSGHAVEKILPVNGHPRTVVSTQNSEYGKVYAASPDSPFLTILRTDLDIVDTTILIEGNPIDVRVSTQNGSSGNNDDLSRTPGYGQPCYLPPSLEPAPTGAQTALQVCQTLP